MSSLEISSTNANPSAELVSTSSSSVPDGALASTQSRPSTPPLHQSSPSPPPITLLRLGSHLRDRVNGLSPQGRTREITRLTHLSGYERDRENNILRNKQLMEWCGIATDGPGIRKSQREKTKSRKNDENDDFQPEGSDSEQRPSGPPAGRPRPRPVRSSRQRQADAVADSLGNAGSDGEQPQRELVADQTKEPALNQNGQTIENSANGSEQVIDSGENGQEHVIGNGEIENEEAIGNREVENDGATDVFNDGLSVGQDELEEEMVDQLDEDAYVPIVSAYETANTNLTQVPAVAVNQDGWPQWLGDWYAVFSAKDFGAVWTTLIARWTVIERGYNWASPVSRCCFVLLMIARDLKFI